MFLLKNLDMNFGEGAIFSVVAMLLVFAVLTILVFSIMLLAKCKLEDKAKKKEEAKAEVQAAPAKKLTIEDITDEDMMVACLVATADYIEETKEKDARVVSVKQIG